LQFDSLRPDALKKIRGADLTRIRRQALEKLERHSLSTTLVCVVEKGVNLDECSEIVDFALNWRCVRGVTFQPVQDAGRADDFAPENRALLTDIRRDIVSKNRIFGERDLIPLPCNPGSICIGYALRNGFDAQPVTSLFSHDDLLESVPNAITFEKYPELQKRLFELFSLSTGPDVMVERLSALLCCLPEVPVPSGLSYENVFRVNIIEFLDARNFCLGNVKRSCIHFVTEERKIVPFETYNRFYRNGRIAEMRKGLATRP
jgi:uncharacterized radical SAM superfamily Fe-S cluster-containing enzyme